MKLKKQILIYYRIICRVHKERTSQVDVRIKEYMKRNVIERWSVGIFEVSEIAYDLQISRWIY